MTSSAAASVLMFRPLASRCCSGQQTFSSALFSSALNSGPCSGNQQSRGLKWHRETPGALNPAAHPAHPLTAPYPFPPSRLTILSASVFHCQRLAADHHLAGEASSCTPSARAPTS